MKDGPGRDPAGGRHGAFETGTRPQDAATRIEIERRQAQEVAEHSDDPSVAHKAGESVKDAAREAKDTVKEKAKEARHSLEEKVESRAERGKSAASDRVDSFARALRQAGSTLEDEGENDLARYGRDTAERVEKFADYLDRRDVSGLLHDLQDTARHNPAAFLGSTFAAGLLMGRFLRSGTPEPESGSRERTTDELGDREGMR